MLQPDLPLRTDRLLLRPFDDDDLEALHAMQGREDVTRYLPWAPRSRAETAAILSRLKTMTAIDAGLRLAGTLPESGTVIGDFSLWRHSVEHRTGEIGYVTHPDHQGHGYATEAAREMLRLGFAVMGLHRIVARSDARNAASIQVMGHLGMRREAHFRENELIRGEWTDEVVYAILEHEWRAGHGTNG
jgi:RimJ/RimL family protein N-acetyltransferase